MSAVRNRSIDVVRGVVMVIMALDHAYDMFGGGRDAFDVATTSPAHFYTRWISNICAPVFIAFAGTAMFLAGRRGKTLPQISSFLLKRALWLILLELTIVRFAWLLDLRYHFILLQVIWVIGCSMLCLAALVWLPRAALVAFGVALIALHDLFDGVRATGAAGALLTFLHHPGEIHVGERLMIGIYYPLVPWVGVMALGYAAGPIVLRPGPERRALYVRAGAAAIALFVVLRAVDAYGDPRPWSRQADLAMTVISFLRCEKYPPSLLFLLMTLGPALLLLAWADRRGEKRGEDDRAFDVLSLYGRTPLFFYVAHLLALHVGSSAYAFLCRALHTERVVGLAIVYLAWVVVVVGLYPACAAFARLKATNKHPLLAYM